MKHIYIIIITILFISCADKITTQKLSVTKSIPSLWEYSISDTSGFVGQWWESFGDSVLNNVFIVNGIYIIIRKYYRKVS